MQRSISQDYISHVRTILDLCLAEVINGKVKVVRQGINGFSRHALPAYVCAVASVEAFLNETFLGQMSRSFTKESPLWNLPSQWLDRLEIRTKLILVPQLLFNASFRKDEQPYQDMSLLIRVRNDLAHYKYGMTVPKYIPVLNDKRITLQPTPTGVDFMWLDKLSCTEGVRWAHNTACRTVHELNSIVPSEIRGFLGSSTLANNFQPIQDTTIKETYKANGIDPLSNQP